MQKAVFSLANYKFDKINIDLANHKSKNLSLSFDVKGGYFNEGSKYELSFVVSVFNQNEKENPFIVVQCKGLFAFENVTSLQEIPEFFYTNSIAILFPYVRAYVSIVTTQANVPGIILPTLNLSSLGDDLKRNTTQI